MFLLPLLEALYDEKPIIRSAVMKALGTQGERVPIEPLLEALHDHDGYIRSAAAQASGTQGERVPIEPLLEALHDKDDEVRKAALVALRDQGERVPIDHFLEAIGDEDMDVRREGIEALSKRAPDVLLRLNDEATAILNRQSASFVLGSIAQTSFCRSVAEMKLALPSILNRLTELISWPHWQVRTNAAQALGSIHRSIPDPAIRRLLELRHQDPVRVVREAADDALAEIFRWKLGLRMIEVSKLTSL